MLSPSEPQSNYKISPYLEKTQFFQWTWALITKIVQKYCGAFHRSILLQIFVFMSCHEFKETEIFTAQNFNSPY